MLSDKSNSFFSHILIYNCTISQYLNYVFQITACSVIQALPCLQQSKSMRLKMSYQVSLMYQVSLIKGRRTQQQLWCKASWKLYSLRLVLLVGRLTGRMLMWSCSYCCRPLLNKDYGNPYKSIFSKWLLQMVYSMHRTVSDPIYVLRLHSTRAVVFNDQTLYVRDNTNSRRNENTFQSDLKFQW